jgi:hypothetical protein
MRPALAVVVFKQVLAVGASDATNPDGPARTGAEFVFQQVILPIAQGAQGVAVAVQLPGI